MFKTLLLGAALSMGQTQAEPPAKLQPMPLPAPTKAQQPPPPKMPPADVKLFPQDVKPMPQDVKPMPPADAKPPVTGPDVLTLPTIHCLGDCKPSCEPCVITWLKPWKCEDLEMKPVERKCRSCCGFFHGLLWCPPAEEEAANGNGEQKNGNGEKKNGNGEQKNGDMKNGEKKNGEKKNGEAKNGEEEKAEEEEAPDRKPLMQLLYCRLPRVWSVMDRWGINASGFVQMGFATDYQSNINDMLFGTNYANRDTNFMLNQAYIYVERALDLDKKKDQLHFGGRVDFYAGHDTPDLENISLGLFENFTGNRLNVNTPYPGTTPPFAGAYPAPSEFGISLPQFYLDTHLPILTDRGVDIRIGRFYTLMGAELNPGTQTDFYTHSYEFYYNAYTHTGAMATVHIADTLDLVNAYVRGWDTVFADYNDTGAYHGALIWNSCDKRKSWANTWMTGPEPTFVSIGQNQLWRTTFTSYFTMKFGCYDQWKWVTGGHINWQPGASAQVNIAGGQEAAEWYGYNNYLFYTVSPKLILGSRVEIYRDDDGFRTGFPTSIVAATLNTTWKPWQNLRLRPELRYDYSTQGTPFNAGTRRNQIVSAIDLIYDF